MRVEKTSFYSDSLRLDGTFYFPQSQEEGSYLIIPCSGFLGLQSIHPIKFARSFTATGYHCFSFDYRGFAESQGPRGRVILEEQITDIVNGVNFAYNELKDKLALQGTILLGWGMGAGLVLEAAPLVPELRGIVCINGFYNGKRVQETVRSRTNWQEFQQWLQAERVRASKENEFSKKDPFFVYPLDEITQKYVDDVLYQDKDFGVEVDYRMADSLLRFRPENRLDELTDTSLLIVHGENNRLHPPKEADSLYEKYPGPKKLFWLPQAGHTEWMHEDHPLYLQMIRRVLDWCGRREIV